MGGRSIACLNSRDRNLLGFRRDLLTAAAYGVDQFLLVHGDAPAVGGRTSELTVRAMIDEVRAFNAEQPFRAGAVCGLGTVPAWKRAADFLFVQISFSLDALLRWRDAARVDVPVYAGVLVLASSRMAKRLGTELGGLEIPNALVDRLECDATAGV